MKIKDIIKSGIDSLPIKPGGAWNGMLMNAVFPEKKKRKSNIHRAIDEEKERHKEGHKMRMEHSGY